MGVFTPGTIIELQTQTRRLAQTFFNTRSLTFTGTEFIDAFIAPDHVPMLKKTEELCGLIGNSAQMNFHAKTVNNNSLYLTADFTEAAPIIVPEYTKQGIRSDAPVELRSKLNCWLEDRWEYGALLGDLQDALEFYNHTCADAKAMAIMVPILPTLMRNITVDDDSRIAKRAKRLAEFKGASTLPALPRAVSKRVHDACYLLTSINLIESVTPPTLKKGDVTIDFKSVWNPPKRVSLFAGIGSVLKNKGGSFL